MIVISAAVVGGITCDLETEMLILTMYLKKYLKLFEKVKYFRKVFKYKYFSFLKVLSIARRVADTSVGSLNNDAFYMSPYRPEKVPE